MKAQKVHVFGKVQGVYFRASAKQKADLIGVKGCVRNEKDGSVYLEIEGDDKAVDRMINWCYDGPANARVSEVKINSFEGRNLNAFNIEH